MTDSTHRLTAADPQSSADVTWWHKRHKDQWKIKLRLRRRERWTRGGLLLHQWGKLFNYKILSVEKKLWTHLAVLQDCRNIKVTSRSQHHHVQIAEIKSCIIFSNKTSPANFIPPHKGRCCFRAFSTLLSYGSKVLNHACFYVTKRVICEKIKSTHVHARDSFS